MSDSVLVSGANGVQRNSQHNYRDRSFWPKPRSRPSVYCIENQDKYSVVQLDSSPTKFHFASGNLSTNKMADEGIPRKVVKSVLSVEQSEGVGAKVRRSVGRPELRNLDPFLLLDEFRVAAPAGFPDHPHRGFETVTYMITGSGTHEDFAGHKGVMHAGDLQWMTAGRGIVHSEMPNGNDTSHGLQLWVNLAKEFKMVEPEYQELQAKNIPLGEKDGVSVKVIAGEALGKKAKVRTRTPTTYLDFTFGSGSKLRQPVTKGHTALVYILSGKAQFGTGEDKKEGEPHNTLVLSDGDFLEVENMGSEPCRFVLITGKPLNEPIVQYGPFVMNTDDEIQQAISDYRTARNGFEKARTWKSETGNANR
ncbi:pirin-like isoform X3 [Lytechinus pictus]|uniref:pirin-like isoform X3 n=1 Tax=Lytechinus pictus TaxID=7653 RepID=UPI0030B9E120